MAFYEKKKNGCHIEMLFYKKNVFNPQPLIILKKLHLVKREPKGCHFCNHIAVNSVESSNRRKYVSFQFQFLTDMIMPSVPEKSGVLQNTLVSNSTLIRALYDSVAEIGVF